VTAKRLLYVKNWLLSSCCIDGLLLVISRRGRDYTREDATRLQKRTRLRVGGYSPQARGRSERGFGTWQGRLPQELRSRGLTTIAAANQFLREQYLSEFNQRFKVKAAERGPAFGPLRRKDLDLVFSL